MKTYADVPRSAAALYALAVAFGLLIAFARVFVLQ
jgi:hypothetical protein